MNKLILIMGLVVGSTMLSMAQNPHVEDLSIPLSNPNEKGVLDVSMRKGGVEITAYDGKEVQIKMTSMEDDHNDNGREDKTSGLKKINNFAMNLDIEESNNVVEIESSNNSNVNLEIRIPRNFDLRISTHHDGDVVVNGVSGELEVNCHHGGMVLNDISGSLIAGTHHGGIKASFVSIDNSKPMAFSTHHGDVDISLPGNAQFDAKIKSAKGDIYTDFDLSMDVKVGQDKKGKKIEMKSWMYGTAGSGGVEYMFNTYHGDVIIRKSK